MVPPEESPAPLNTFVVRLWREVRAGQVCWRGRVRHVQSGQQAAFADEAGLLDFVRRWVRLAEGKDRDQATG
ncbi:MAG TPA: hypothetical protein ENK08_02485 [Chloroflexi bacterium]|nr:hypothetical protein [Chloroflexota bacterium]